MRSISRGLGAVFFSVLILPLAVISPAKAATLQSLAITPSLPRIFVDQFQGFTVTGTFSDGPPQVLGGSLTTITAGAAHTCALLAGGQAQCWGDNSLGQLGDASTDLFSNIPAAVFGITTATAIAAGGSHSCALLTGGTVQCWGDNSNGQLGNSSTGGFSNSPVPVTGISTATAIAAGGSHSCALLTGGTVQCWGDNSNGQLGNSSTGGFSNSPVPVTGISTATAIATGDAHTCALLTGGTVQCWGDNSNGQLGDGTTTNSSTPVTVTIPPNTIAVTAIAVGGHHSCMLLNGVIQSSGQVSNGQAWCWGLNSGGQLGDGTNTDSPIPVKATGTPSTAITAGGAHNCVILATPVNLPPQNVQCWGSDSSGQLGDGILPLTDRNKRLTYASGIPDATAIAAGGSHSCARLPGGTAQCWGADGSGQLGDGSATDSPIPVPVTGPVWSSINPPDVEVATISAGGLASGLAAGQATITVSMSGISGIEGNTTLFVDPAPTYTIGGTISGLTGTVVLNNNGNDPLTLSADTIPADGSYAFPTALISTTPYNVVVTTLPKGQICKVTNGNGIVSGSNITGSVVPGSNVTNANVICATIPAGSYAIGFAVIGLKGTLVLTNNGADDTTVHADGGYTFFTPIASGKPYGVAVKTQPAGQVCALALSGGIVGTANITNVLVTCKDIPAGKYTIGGTITGLTGTVTLKNNGSDAVSLSATDAFTFPTSLANSSQSNNFLGYTVSVAIQPAGQTCTVANGTGKIAGANITSVTVSCIPGPYAIGGAISGLTGTVLLKNNNDTLSLTANGVFAFIAKLPSGAAYDVSVITQPTGETCDVTNGTGTVDSDIITNISVTCTADSSGGGGGSNGGGGGGGGGGGAISPIILGLLGLFLIVRRMQFRTVVSPRFSAQGISSDRAVSATSARLLTKRPG